MDTLQTWMSQSWFLFTIGFLGMISHFLKKFQDNEVKLTEKDPIKAIFSYFFETDVINTILCVICYVVIFFYMYQQHELSVYTAFSSGYLSDSLLNKAGQKGLSI